MASKNTNSTRPSDFDAAKDRARAVAAANAGGPADPTTALAVPEPTGLILRADNAAAAAALFDGAEMAPVFVTLTEGDAVQGVFERFGSVATAEVDKFTGEIKTISTVVLAVAGGGKLEFNSAHEIDRALGHLRGTEPGKVLVTVLRGPEERIDGGRSVTRYRVGFRKVGS